LRRQFAVPAQDVVRLGDGGDVGQNLAAQAITDLTQRTSLRVRELRPTIQLRLEEAILGSQTFVPRR
jgi:hypothetical protein